MTRVQDDEAWGGHTPSRCRALLLVFIDRALNGHSIVFVQHPSVQLTEPCWVPALSQALRNQILIVLGCSDFKVGLPT